MLEYLERVFGYTPKTAIDRLRVAHTLEDHPALGKVGLSFSALREISRVVTAETVEEWIGKCRGQTVHEIEKLVSGLKKGDRPGAPRGPQDHVVRLELKPQPVALLREVQRELADETGGAVSDDAVVNALCRAYLDGGEIGAQEAGVSDLDYDVRRLLQELSRRRRRHGRAAPCRSRPGAVRRGPRGPARRPRADPPTVDIPAATRAFVWRRDHGRCQAPGCRAKRNLELHHIKHREHGGTHDAENIILLCSGHHACYHAGTLAITGTGSRPCFTQLRDPTPTPAKTVDDDVLQYLRGMDVPVRQARELTARARAHVDAHPSVETLLRAALRELHPSRATGMPR